MSGGEASPSGPEVLVRALVVAALLVAAFAAPAAVHAQQAVAPAAGSGAPRADVELPPLILAPPPLLVADAVPVPLRAGVAVASRLAVLKAPVAPAAPAAPVAAVRRAEPPNVWKRAVELAGSLFIGNKPQTVLTTRGKASHADSTFELGLDLRFTYGETSQDGVREVSQRLWFGSANVDFWPYARQSPFLLGTVESSLERRIDLRVSGGVGHKVTFVDTDRALANLSVAILAERSRLPQKTGEILTEQLARFSTRLRLRRSVGERTKLAFESFFRPEYANLQRYTISDNVSAAYRMNEMMNLKLSYLDNYDSEARGRGSRSNYDGQLVVGLQADF